VFSKKFGELWSTNKKVTSVDVDPLKFRILMKLKIKKDIRDMTPHA